NENGPSSLTAFLAGQAIDTCVEKEDELSVLRAGNEKLTLADANKLSALTETYGRVIFAKAYASDGVTAVLAKVADKIVYAFDYKTARVKNAYALSAEMDSSKKAAGACIENTGKGFVGTTAYIGDEEDASF
ncbi:MAG: hypothetical protein K2M95_04815, partial [Clostridiales bacterium]|nr:hypothetical protein [Clostridiales bacterium]